MSIEAALHVYVLIPLLSFYVTRCCILFAGEVRFCSLAYLPVLQNDDWLGFPAQALVYLTPLLALPPATRCAPLTIRAPYFPAQALVYLTPLLALPPATECAPLTICAPYQALVYLTPLLALSPATQCAPLTRRAPYFQLVVRTRGVISVLYVD